MTQEIVSILVFGDSHTQGIAAQNFEFVGPDMPRPMTAMIKSFFAGAGFIAMDSVVTYPDGRSGLSPMFELGLRHWSGLDWRGNPTTEGALVHKHLVLSLGTSLSDYDPALDYEDRSGGMRYIFPHDIDFVLDARPDLPVNPSNTLIPVALIREMYIAILAPFRQGLSALAEEYAGRIWILGSPPPAESNDAKLRKFNSIFPDISEPVRLSSPTVLLKVWLLVNQCVRDICAETGVQFIDCSPIAGDARGFFRSEFINDGVHGNVRYGKAIAQHLATTIGKAELKRQR